MHAEADHGKTDQTGKNTKTEQFVILSNPGTEPERLIDSGKTQTAGERFLLRYLESFGFRKMLIKNRAADKVVQKAMIYGGGLFCRLYLTNIYSGTLNNKMIDVCGIIDDDFALHHLSVYGFKVRGGIKDLETIYAKTPFDRIVIALKDIPEEREKIILDFAQKKNITVQRFTCSELDLFTPVVDKK